MTNEPRDYAESDAGILPGTEDVFAAPSTAAPVQPPQPEPGKSPGGGDSARGRSLMKPPGGRDSARSENAG